MTISTTAQVTRLLRDWQSGDQQALERLLPLVYDELHVIASRYTAREWRDGALQPTALVNEAYVKLVDQHDVNWQNRAHFFAVAAQIMRRILLDDARGRLRDKRGGGAIAVDLEGVAAAVSMHPLHPVDLIAIDDALTGLEQIDPEQARLVELRFYAGLTIEETAAVLGSSPASVKREWAIAKGWLRRALTGTGAAPAAG